MGSGASSVENKTIDAPSNTGTPSLLGATRGEKKRVAPSAPVDLQNLPADVHVNAMDLGGTHIVSVEISSRASGAQLKTQIINTGSLNATDTSYRLLYNGDVVREFEPISASGLVPGQDNLVVVLTEPISAKTQFVFSGVKPGPRKAFDTQGLLYWLGTERGSSEYRNPAERNVVSVEWNSLYKGPKAAFVDNDFNDKADSADGHVVNRGDGWHHTNHGPGEHWMRVDLGEDIRFCPDFYCLRHGSSGKTGGGCWDLRKWYFQASNDDRAWTTLHTGSDKLVDGCCGAWEVDNKLVDGKPAAGFRYFRILMHAADHGGAWLLALGGIELYGERQIVS